MPLLRILFVYLQKPKHCIDMEKNEIINKPKDEVTNKPKEIKIEISCEIVDDGKTPKIKYVNRAATVAFWSFVLMIVGSFLFPVYAIIPAAVCAIAFLKAVDKVTDRDAFPEKYE